LNHRGSGRGALLASKVWRFFAKPTSDQLVEIHVSLGPLLAGVPLVRIFWRLSFGRRLLAAETCLMRSAAKLGQAVLYLLLVAGVGAGFCMHWAAKGQVSFFGLFAIPAPYPVNDGLAKQLLPLHYWLATALIIVAGGHASIALFHCYVLRDGVLQRMLPLHHYRPSGVSRRR
jgi:cytochrome b561